MKQPLYALLISPDEGMRHRIETHEKTITIREGHRDYRAGPVMLSCQIVPWAVMADITDVRHCTLREVAREEWEADGFVSQTDLLAQMRRYYPKLALDSEVTVIRWKDARGALVERHAR